MGLHHRRRLTSIHQDRVVKPEPKKVAKKAAEPKLVVAEKYNSKASESDEDDE